MGTCSTQCRRWTCPQGKMDLSPSDRGCRTTIRKSDDGPLMAWTYPLAIPARGGNLQLAVKKMGLSPQIRLLGQIRPPARNGVGRSSCEAKSSRRACPRRAWWKERARSRGGELAARGAEDGPVPKRWGLSHNDKEVRRWACPDGPVP